MNEKAIRAIELKYLGNSYADIAESIGVEHSTVKSWFMRSGRLYTPYLNYASEQTNEQTRMAKILLSGALLKAVKIMGELLDSKDDRIKLATAKEIIRRELIPENVPPEQPEIRVADILALLQTERDAEEKSRESVIQKS